MTTAEPNTPSILLILRKRNNTIGLYNHQFNIKINFYRSGQHNSNVIRFEALILDPDT